jgi:hypothetical protein
MKQKTVKISIPKHRKIEEVNIEYQQLCLRAGDLEHRIRRNPLELDKIYKRLAELDAEADIVRKLTAAEEEKKKADEEARKNA